jgi:hypothetical protein
MQKFSQIDQSVRTLWLVEFEKHRKLVACVHNLNRDEIKPVQAIKILKN